MRLKRVPVGTITGDVRRACGEADAPKGRVSRTSNDMVEFAKLLRGKHMHLLQWNETSFFDF